MEERGFPVKKHKEGLCMIGKFPKRFLGAVLAKGALAGHVGLPDVLHGLEFGNCHQLNG